MVLQAEMASKLINNTGATIQGILLAFIVILITFLGVLWRARVEDQKYIREQDKANLEMLLTVANTVKDIGAVSSKNGDTLGDVKETSTTILSIIKERLSK